LAHEDQVVVGAERREPEMQQLRGIDHRRGDARSGKRRHGGVAGVVGASHPGEDQGAEPSCTNRLEVLDVTREPGRGPSEGVRLAGDLGDEWVRKLS
jgi:hypothetical protein